VQTVFPEEMYELSRLDEKFRSFLKPEMGESAKRAALTRAAAELTTQEAPHWEFIAARILMHDFAADLSRALDELQLHSYFEKVSYLCERGLYGSYILESYTKEELDEAGTFINPCARREPHLLRAGAVASPLCDPAPQRPAAGNPAGDVSRHCAAPRHARKGGSSRLGQALLRHV
jgi:hypothetical protein